VAGYQQPGQPGLVDRPSTAHSHPRRVPDAVQAEIARLRRTRKLGPARIAVLVGRAASTVHRMLVRLGLNRLAWMDRPTERLVRRYERAAAGELLHVDVKKLGRLGPGGGHRVHGRDSAQHRTRDRDRHRGHRVGYDYVHAAVDDHIRMWPTPRSWPTSAATPARASCAAPARSSPPTASPSSGC
jgi:hypothetical protein